MKYVLYNPLSHNNMGEKDAGRILKQYPDDRYTFVDVTSLSLETLNDILDCEDEVVITGGDGTLNKFANFLADRKLTKTIYFYPSGSGNDFMNDIRGKNVKELVELNKYLEDLPVIHVNGGSYRFLNGVGYGVDGYSCEVVEAKRKESGKKGSYTFEALKGLMYSYKPGKAKITVDGVTTEHENVWMVSVMKGRYFGGGVMIAPMQDRLNEEKTVSVLVVSSKNRIKTLFAFPSIFKGKHMKYTNLVTAFTGKDIKVELDRPSALQIDGDVLSDVSSYTVTAGCGASKDAEREISKETV